MTLSALLKQLSRKYGYAALAVYSALSALDFPSAFLLYGTSERSALQRSKNRLSV